MNLQENSPHEIGQEEMESPLQTPNLLEDIGDSPQMSRPAALASGNDNRTNPGMRVLRTSPILLVSCVIVFASLIFLLDLRAQTDTSVEQKRDASLAVSNSPEKNRSVPASMPPEKVREGVTAATPQPSAPPAVTTPAPEEAAATSPPSQIENEEPAAQPSTPPTDTRAGSDAENSGVEATRAGASGDQGNYTLQVGSFNDQAEAGERVARLGSLGIKAYVARVEIPKRGTWYRVQTGSFASREEAGRYGAQLRSKGAVADFIITSLLSI